MNYIRFYVDNYFKGYQLISLCRAGLLSWHNRDTEKQCYELATLGMDGVE
nr:MAG TPA: hypothetical protein [Caudoviricetes sp.]